VFKIKQQQGEMTTKLILVVIGLTSVGAILVPTYAVPTIRSGDIFDGEVKTADIANNAVTSPKIQNGQVNTDDLANNAVTTGKIADGTIQEQDIAEGTIPPASGGTPDDNSVTSATIVDGEVKSADIGNGEVTSEDVADGTITSTDLAEGTIPPASGMPTIHIVSTAKLIVVTPLQIQTTTVDCPAGEIVTGGGFSTRDDVLRIMDSNPEDADTWTVTAKNDNFIDTGSFRAHALCMGPSP
jgi:hypothetical protein